MNNIIKLELDKSSNYKQEGPPNTEKTQMQLLHCAGKQGNDPIPKLKAQLDKY